MDEFSRYPFVKKISSLAAKTVSSELNQLFSMFGIPSQLKSDNGPPFNSYEFSPTLPQRKDSNIIVSSHTSRIPNGLFERIMRNMNKIVKKPNPNGNWELELHTKPSTISAGDEDLLNNRVQTKTTAPYDQNPYKLIGKSILFNR